MTIDRYHVEGDFIVDQHGAILYEDISQWSPEQRELMIFLHECYQHIDFVHAWAIVEAIGQQDKRAALAAWHRARRFNQQQQA